MVVAFPHLYASAFSGFYLALMLVLWLLILRGIGIELRHQVDDPLWRRAWDVTFSGASALLAVLFGVALGNVMRGVPFDAQGEFVGSFALLLNPFAMLGGVLSLVLLSMHGAAYLFLKTDGAMHGARVGPLACCGGWASPGILAIVPRASSCRPEFPANSPRWPWLLALPLLTIASLAGVRRSLAATRSLDVRLHIGLIAGLLTSVFAGLFPRPAAGAARQPPPGLDIYNAAGPPKSLPRSRWRSTCAAW